MRGRPAQNDFMSKLEHAFSPKERLHTLFMLHSIGSLLIGVLGFFFPWLFGVFFTDSSVHDGVHGSTGGNVAHVMIRLYCALIVAQGWIISHLVKANGKLKKVIVQSFFGCFLASTLALLVAHFSNDGTMSGGFFGTIKLIAFIGLTVGYGWFAFFQPPKVFEVLGSSI